MPGTTRHVVVASVHRLAADRGIDHVDEGVPAHRVVNRNGLLTGKHHFNPPDAMEKLLKKEGIIVKDDKVVDFNARFWDPAIELSL